MASLLHCFFCTCAFLQQQNLGPGPCGMFFWQNLCTFWWVHWVVGSHFHVIAIVKWYNVPVVADQSPDHILERARICKVSTIFEPELLLGWTMGHNGTHQTEQQVFFSIPSLRRSACNSRLASDFRLPPHLSSAVSLRGKCWTNTELDTFVWSKWVVAEKSHNVSFILYDYSLWLYLTI